MNRLLATFSLLFLVLIGLSTNVSAQDNTLAKELSLATKSISTQSNIRELKESLSKLNGLSAKVNQCLQELSSKPAAELTDDDKKQLDKCNDYQATIDKYKQTINNDLNRLSFSRYKQKDASLINAIADSKIFSESFTVDLSPNKLWFLILSSVFFVTCFFLLAALKRYQNKHTESRVKYWYYPAILLLCILNYIFIWFYDFSKIEPLLYWHSMVLGATLTLISRKEFSTKTFVVGLLIIAVNSLSGHYFVVPTTEITLIKPIWLDWLYINTWLLLVLIISWSWLKQYSKIAALFFILVNFLELYGYHITAHQLVLTAAIIRFSWLTFQLIKLAVPELISNLYTAFERLPFNKLEHHAIQQLAGKRWVETGLSALVLLLILTTQLQFFGIPLYYTEQLVFALENEVSIGTISLSISSILEAIITFGILLSLAKVMQHYLERKNATSDANTNEALGSIFWYGAVVTAGLTALSIAGFSVQNLALVAGAFSIGIGFGLQNIVSNFVSGLILLIERPIKKGDWVVIGSTEGLVKKVSIRATEIQTFDRADIIVPNSDLITNQVTNWMLNDRIARIKVAVGVAYGSPTEKVKQILLNVAESQPELIKNNEQYPIQVHFINFGDSSLDFEIRAFLNDVTDIYRVRSALNFKIDQAFRENDIEIPFPQRDLHIRSDATK